MIDYSPGLRRATSSALPLSSPGFAQSMSAAAYEDTGYGLKQASLPTRKSPTFGWKQEMEEVLVEYSTKCSNSPRKEEESVPTQPYGWITPKLAKVPLFYPSDLTKLELPKEEFQPTLKRLQTFFRKQSIQATFHDEPAWAELSTMDQTELRIKFWEGNDPESFIVDVQRRKGDQIHYGRILRQLLDVVNGVEAVEENDDEAMELSVTPDELEGERIKELQAVVERMVPQDTTESEASATKTVIHMVHKCLTSRSFGERTTGLEVLVNFTDMRKTMVSAALQGAHVFLRGRAPSAEDPEQQEDLDRKCREIQQVLFTVLSRGCFDGDEDLRKHLQKADISLVSKNSNKRKRGHYETAILSSTHKILTVLVNALDSLCCTANFNEGHHNQMFMEFFRQCEECTGTDLYTTLLECIDNCENDMAVSYLACRAMRLLVNLFPPLKDQLQGDAYAGGCVEKACQTGTSCHSLLEAESKRLRDGIQA